MENKKSSLSRDPEMMTRGSSHNDVIFGYGSIDLANDGHDIYGSDAKYNSETIMDENEGKPINGYSIPSSHIKPIFAGSYKIDSELTNCTFIGINAGVAIDKGDGIVIIGDNIKNLNPEDNEDALFLGSKVAIGKTLFGAPINVVDVFENYLNITQGGIKDFIKNQSNLDTSSKE